MPMRGKPVAIGFNVPFNEAIASMEKRGIVLPDKYYGELQRIERQLAFSIAGVTSIDKLQNVLNSLTDKLSKGATFQQWQKDIRVQDLDLPKHRLDTIYRTNLQATTNRGRWEQFQQTKNTRPYLMYDAVNDSRTRPTHKAMDGIIRPIDDPFWQTHYPSNGYRCRCRAISLTAKQANDRSKNGEGLNKPITSNMRPDNGWDYNVGEDLTAGVNRAISERTNSKSIHPKLINALESKLKKGASSPVSDALVLPKSGYAKIPSKNILTIIDSIHSDGELPEIPIKASSSEKFYGSYAYRPNGKVPVEIKLSKYGDHPELTLAHEIGHFIDHQAFGEKGFSSTNNEMFAGWRDAVANSNATKEIKSIGDSNSNYYLSAHEQWARSYAQYIATKSGDINLIKQLDDIRNGDRVSPIRKLSQWQDDDFELISKEIDKLFLKMRWL
jgi:SPP1 gp7 family putative phage head morphogenesis protein